jgi:hypothetical protein
MPTTLIQNPATLLENFVPDVGASLTPPIQNPATLPGNFVPDVGANLTPQTLVWQGGSANDDPTVAANWNPNATPQMDDNQTLFMNSGTMNLDGGNLAANELNVTTPTGQTATINLTDHGSLDLNVPGAASPNVNVTMTGGGEGVLNVFSGPSADPDINVSIDASKLDLMGSMSFGKLDVNSTNGGSVFLQGDSQFNGTSVTLNTALDGFGSVELTSSGLHAGRMDLSSQLPLGVPVKVDDHTPGAGANGVVFEQSADSTISGGLITLDDGFVKLRGLAATSYTQTGNEFDLFNNGVKVDALDVVPAVGASPLQVASNAYGVYIYNANPSTMPLGAGNGLGGGAGTGGGTGGGTGDVGSILSPLPMHG